MTATSNTKPSSAARQIAAFEKRFGRSHLYLAYHAAFPIALTPDLLYRLRLNFQQDNAGQPLNIPWIAVSDLLLSNLCHEVGYELYQMDIVVRNELLTRLQQDPKFGQQRIKLLSDFLLDYVQQELQNRESDEQAIANVQRWVALAYTRPHKTAYEITSFLSKLNFNNKAELLRLEVLLQTLAIPLEQFDPLFSYVQGIAAFARGKFSEATRLLKPLLGSERQIRIVGVKLPIPDPVQTLLDEAQAYPNYRHANLQAKSFKGQDLTNADFSYADLRSTDFTNANLTGANFSHARMGFKPLWTILLISCAIVLSITAGIGAMLTSNFLQAALMNPPSKEIFSIVLISSTLSILIGLLTLRRGIEATLGAFVFAVVGMLYFLGAVFGITELAGFTTTWDWLTRILLAIAGIITFAIGISSSRLGVLNFAGKWANWWIGVCALGSSAYATHYFQHLLGRYTPYVVTGIGEGALRTWFENRLNNLNPDAATYSTTLIIVIGVIGIVFSEAISIVLVKSINQFLALSIGLAWIPIWLGRLSLSSSMLHSTGTIITVILIAGLGTYVGWRSLVEDSLYSFLNQAAAAFISKFLGGTRFCAANLTDANFSGATVAYVNFSDANLTRVAWFQAKALNLAHVTETYLNSKAIRELVTTGQGQGKVFDRLSLQGINLSGANLANASLIGTDLRDATLQDADLSRVKLSQTQLENADLTGACLTGATIQNWRITDSTKFDGIECDYIYTRFTTSDHPDPVRQPEDWQRRFEPGDFADFIQQSDL